MARLHVRTARVLRAPRIPRGLHALAAAAVLAACGGDAKGPPPVTLAGVEIQTRGLVVELAGRAELRARVFSSTGSTLQREIEWRCSRPDLVVSCGPELVPRDTGTILVVARVDGFVDTATVRIYEEGMREVNVAEPFPFAATQLVQGAALLIKLQVRDSAGADRNDRRLIWQVSDSAVAAVRDTMWSGNQKLWHGGILRAVGPGSATVRVTVGGIQTSLDIVVRPRIASCDDARALALDMAVGELKRFRGTDAGLPNCLQFRHARDAGRRYLVMTERLPLLSSSQQAGARGLFQAAGAVPGDSLIVQLYTPETHALQLAAGRAEDRPAPVLQHAHAAHAQWTVGGRELHELPQRRRAAVQDVRTVRPAGLQAQAVAGARFLMAGDTLVIPELRSVGADAIWSGEGARSDRAVIAHVGENLIIAEHIEVFDRRLRRFNGQASAPVPAAQYAAIDAGYRAGRTQLDRLFGPLPAIRTLAAAGDSVAIPAGREIVVNTILPRNSWGTAAGDVAFMDYWIDTDGITPGVLQDAMLLANQLISHEMAHVRHFQLQPQTPLLLWSVEGIARFVEHLAFAATVLRSDTPSRTGNAVAGAAGYPTSPQLRYNKEMPSAIGLETNFFGGYGGSGYIFDYLADHVEAAGGDGLRAVRDLLLAAHSRSAADAAVARVLGAPLGIRTLDELVTRARLALHLDDYAGATALPAWTQYLQFNIPASRPWHANWPAVVPGAVFSTARQVGEGVAWGFVIDGSTARVDQDFLLDVSHGDQTVVSVVRIQ